MVLLSTRIQTTRCSAFRAPDLTVRRETAAPHHGAVDGGNAVVAHVQRRQLSPHGNHGRDGTPRLRPLGLPLRELAGLRDEDGLDGVGTQRSVSGPDPEVLVGNQLTIMDSVERWMVSVARLDLRDGRPWICFELQSLI